MRLPSSTVFGNRRFIRDGEIEEFKSLVKMHWRSVTDDESQMTNSA